MGKKLLTVVIFMLLLSTVTVVWAEVLAPVVRMSGSGQPPQPLDSVMLGTVVAGTADSTAATSQQLDDKFYRSINGAVDLPDRLLFIRSLVSDEVQKTDQYQKSRRITLESLVNSITAIEDKEVGLPYEAKLKVADAALSAQETTGIDAVFLIALARLESDFRNIINLNFECKYKIRNYGCYADCGMTQNHVRGPLKYVKARCERFNTDLRTSFRESAVELVSHTKWCNARNYQSWHRPVRRCILNRYNQGPFYKTEEQCDKSWACSRLSAGDNESVESFSRRKALCNYSWKRCFTSAAYWKKLTCFEYGARKLQRSLRSCRYCTSIGLVSSFFYAKPIEPSNSALVRRDPAIVLPDSSSKSQ